MVFVFFFKLFGCVGSSLLYGAFLQLWRAGVTLHCGARVSHCGGFSCCGAQALCMRASIVVARGLSSRGSRAQLLRDVWDLPRPGLKPVCPELADGFLTTASLGKSPTNGILIQYWCLLPIYLKISFTHNSIITNDKNETVLTDSLLSKMKNSPCFYFHPLSLLPVFVGIVWNCTEVIINYFFDICILSYNHIFNNYQALFNTEQVLMFTSHPFTAQINPVEFFICCVSWFL